MKIQHNVVPFDGNGEAVVTLPFASIGVNLRLYRDHPIEPAGSTGPAIDVIINVTDASVLTTIQRKFIFWPEGTELPADYMKWVGTLPNASGALVDVIEVPPSSTDAAESPGPSSASV